MNKSETRIVFMGTPNIAAYVLEALILDGYNFVGLVAQPDKPVGRKGDLEKVPTKVVAEKYNIPVYQPTKIRNDYEFLKELNPDLILTLAYGQIVPEGVLNIPKFGCLNLHGSLLPKYRGAAPIQYALINRDKISGMTLMEMTRKMDAGKMFAKKELEILDSDNSTSLFIRMGECAKELALEALPKYLNGELIGEEQDESQVSLCPTIKPEQEKIDLDLTCEEILGWIKGLSDTPGAYFYLEGLKLKVYKAHVVDCSFEGNVGQIVQADKKGLVVKLKDGYLSLDDLQKEGKKRMDYRSFLNGNQNILGKVLN